MRKITKYSVMLKELAYMRNKTQYAYRERERERHKEVSLIKNATVTT